LPNPKFHRAGGGDGSRATADHQPDIKGLNRFMENYVAFVRRDAETGYEVEFPDMPECRCQGSTVEEAFHRAARALKGHTARLRRRGEASRHRGIVAAACLRVLS
jgi:predicted RNase H-like HicB family nuclease